MILITGTTGLVGTHLLASLVQTCAPSTLRAQYRSTVKKEECLQIIERVYGKEVAQKAAEVHWYKADITQLPELEKGFVGIRYLYHCAGLISTKPSQRKQLRKINIEGTANVVNLAILHQVEKIGHVSSIATLGKSNENGLIDEDSYRENLNNSSYYSIAKYGGEMEVWRASQEGVDVVIINPGVILGEGFYKDGSGELFRQVAQGFPFKIEKKTGFIGVKDVVKTLQIAMQSPIKNERFVVVESNLKISEVQKLMADGLEVKPPLLKLQKWMMYVYWFTEFWLRLLGRERKISLDVLPTLLDDRIYSNEKVRSVLGCKFTPIQEVIKDCCKDYKKSTK